MNSAIDSGVLLFLNMIVIPFSSCLLGVMIIFFAFGNIGGHFPDVYFGVQEQKWPAPLSLRTLY